MIHAIFGAGLGLLSAMRPRTRTIRYACFFVEMFDMLALHKRKREERKKERKKKRRNKRKKERQKIKGILTDFI